MDDKETIVKFLEQMSTQDNRHTAFPIYYVIRSVEWIPTRDTCGDEVRYYNSEYHESWLTQDEWDALPDESEEPNGDRAHKEDYEEVDVKKTWVEHGMFLTETDAEKHLKLNAHHYSKDAHTYVKCACQAPELKEFLLALFGYFGVEPRRDKGTM